MVHATARRAAVVLGLATALTVSLVGPASADPVGVVAQEKSSSTGGKWMTVIQHESVTWGSKYYIGCSFITRTYCAKSMLLSGYTIGTRRSSNAFGGPGLPAAVSKLCLTDTIYVDGRSGTFSATVSTSPSVSLSVNNTTRTVTYRTCARNASTVRNLYGTNGLVFRGAALKKLSIHSVLRAYSSTGTAVGALGAYSSDVPDQYNY
jgi:hypothetical protein